MRDAPASIEAMLGTTQLTLSRCAKFVLRDGFEFGVTEHDRALTVALDNDQYDPIEYRPNEGMIVGDCDIAIGLDADNTDMGLVINEMITRSGVLARRFHMADVYLFDVDWTQPTPEPMEIMAGYIAEARPGKSKATFEIRSQADRWNTVIGRVLSPRCNADFGDERCGVTPGNTLATVVDVISNMRFIVDAQQIFADDYFRFGEVEFISGDLAQTWPFEIVAFDGYEGEVEILAPMPGFPAFGDQLFLRNGCSKVKEAPDDPLVPTCVFYNNALRFRGFDQTPGTDRFVRFPIPGQPGI